MPIALKIEYDNAVASRSRDICEGGLCFLWDDYLETGIPVHITIFMKAARFELNGRVAYSKREKDTGYYRTGLTFMDADNAFKAKLAEETREILDYQQMVSRVQGHEVPVEEAAEEWIAKYAERFNRE